MSGSWPPTERTSAVSYIDVGANSASVESKTTAINFSGSLMSASAIGGGSVNVAVGIQEVQSDPASPQAGDFWILRVENKNLRHSILQVGLSGPTDSYRYYFKYRTARNTTVSVELT